MRKLLNTLYVTSENSYLALDGENLVVYDEKKELGRLPLHNLDGIVSFPRRKDVECDRKDGLGEIEEKRIRSFYLL